MIKSWNPISTTNPKKLIPIKNKQKKFLFPKEKKALTHWTARNYQKNQSFQVRANYQISQRFPESQIKEALQKISKKLFPR